MRRTIALLTTVAFMLGLIAAPATAQDRPPPFNQPHNHALLVGADVTFVENPPPGTPPYVINGFRKCVELAGGSAVPLNAHHDRLHFGPALNRSPHFVVPLGILGFGSCTELENALLP